MVRGTEREEGPGNCPCPPPRDAAKHDMHYILEYVPLTWTFVLSFVICPSSGSHHRSLGTHISLPKGCTGTYWWGEDEIQHMKTHGNFRAKQVYGDPKPQVGVTKDDPTKWKQFLNEKYVQKKYAPGPTSYSSPTPPLTPSKASSSPQSFKKFTNVPMPDIDLIHFENVGNSISSPTHHTSPSVTQQTKLNIESPKPTNDFFANFGL